jgi:hypothetical protein
MHGWDDPNVLFGVLVNTENAITREVAKGTTRDCNDWNIWNNWWSSIPDDYL